MQIDFHHAVTYVAARIAGMDHAKADIIAYAAQYVDDATNHGYIRFDNGVTIPGRITGSAARHTRSTAPTTSRP